MTPLDYLQWLRDRRGLPELACHRLIEAQMPGTVKTMHIKGITFTNKGVGEAAMNGAYSIPMPGASTAYMRSLGNIGVEELDDAGNVIRSSRIGTKGGKLAMDQKKVRALVGPVAKLPRVASKPTSVAPVVKDSLTAAPPVAPVITTNEEPAPMSEAFAALCSAAPAPAPAVPAPVAPSDDVAALRATVDALLGRVTALEANQPVVLSSRAPREVRERMVRSYLRTRAEREQARRDHADIWQQQSALVEELEEVRTDNRELTAQLSSLARELAEAREALAMSEAARITFADEAGAAADVLAGEAEQAQAAVADAMSRADAAEASRDEAIERAARMEARANALEAAQAAFSAKPYPYLPVIDLPPTSALILPLRASSRRDAA